MCGDVMNRVCLLGVWIKYLHTIHVFTYILCWHICVTQHVDVVLSHLAVSSKVTYDLILFDRAGLGSMNILSVPTAIYCCFTLNKCNYCKSLWIKATPTCPKCKCNVITLSYFRRKVKSSCSKMSTG